MESSSRIRLVLDEEDSEIAYQILEEIRAEEQDRNSAGRLRIYLWLATSALLLLATILIAVRIWL